MKKVFLPVLVGLILIASTILPGCDGESSTGEVITEKKALSNFNSIDIGSAFEVDITRSDTYSVVISADESLFAYFHTAGSYHSRGKISSIFYYTIMFYDYTGIDDNVLTYFTTGHYCRVWIKHAS